MKQGQKIKCTKLVAQQLEQLEYNDLIEIKWLDACRALNVSLPFIGRNRTFATYKRQIGRFHAILKDAVYGESFLVVIIEQDGAKCTLVSIPTAVIMRIAVLSKMQPMKLTNMVGETMLAGSVELSVVRTREGAGEEIEEEECKDE